MDVLELLREAASFALVIRVNTMNGPDEDADWDALYEWADGLARRLDEAVIQMVVAP